MERKATRREGERKRSSRSFLIEKKENLRNEAEKKRKGRRRRRRRRRKEKKYINLLLLVLGCFGGEGFWFLLSFPLGSRQKKKGTNR